MDDIVIFSSGNSKSVNLIMKQIKNYEKAYGLKVNDNKSFFLTSPKTSAFRINRLRCCTGFMEKSFPFTYLVCPLYIGRKRISYFDAMVTMFVKNLSGQQGKMLSHGGRMVLIVLQSLPIYIFSVVFHPKNSLNLLDKYFSRYFWGSSGDKNKYHCS
ncbi:uncharacterized protein [Nicotiana tomentosiformis]|uniref:uncharacterized protein n=1 Tax=Nicotiana tomentosiformis TaxID=4098 RepID=UPI00388C7BCB